MEQLIPVFNELSIINCFSLMKKSLSKLYLEYALNDKSVAKFNFKNGTTVHANDLDDAILIMKKIIKNYNGEFWANEIADNLWEVQFSKADLPQLYVTVHSFTGNQAATIALKHLNNDIDSLDILSIN
jgi:hypothetical protein